jgi:thymidylate synthase (FAD)
VQDYVRETLVGPKLPFPDRLSKLAGQLCYFALGPKRTKNTEAGKYFSNIRESRHGSVLEHGSFSFLLYGEDRTVTHEAVRHRTNSFSQLSQRYVDASVLRFVERPEYQNDPELHALFEQRIDRAAKEYTELADKLLAKQMAGDPLLVGERKTEARKNVQQAARSCLPGETEAPLVMTGNVRAWRHFLEMRASPHADKPIRDVAMKIYWCLIQCTDLLADYEVIKLPDGTTALKTPTEKV